MSSLEETASCAHCCLGPVSLGYITSQVVPLCHRDEGCHIKWTPPCPLTLSLSARQLPLISDGGAQSRKLMQET